jgi:hypothetical protein
MAYRMWQGHQSILKETMCVCVCVFRVCVCEAPTSEKKYPDMETQGNYPELLIH